MMATVMLKPWMVGEVGIVSARMTTAFICFGVTLAALAFVNWRVLRDIRAANAGSAMTGAGPTASMSSAVGAP
jgi:hypothetical protein